MPLFSSSKGKKANQNNPPKDEDYQTDSESTNDKGKDRRIGGPTGTRLLSFLNRKKATKKDNTTNEGRQIEPTNNDDEDQRAGAAAEPSDANEPSLESLDKGRLPIPFRILILGRANAGKTTILERITGGSEAEALVFRNGKLLKGQEVKGQADRGLHDVEDEICFPSRPGFIFHDTRGFEAGSGEELEKVRQFVEDSSKVTDVYQQLHAIWMCLPLNEAREIFDTEKKVFEWSRGSIPLVVISTKRDGAITEAVEQIMNSSLGSTDVDSIDSEEILCQALGQAETIVNDRIKEREINLRPKLSEADDVQTIVFLTTSNMEEDTNETADTCNRLIEATEDALTGPTLKSSLCQAWSKNYDRLAYWTFFE